MAHNILPVEFHVHPVTGARAITANRSDRVDDRVTVHLGDIDYTTTEDASHQQGVEQLEGRSMRFYFANLHNIFILCTQAEQTQIIGFFYGPNATIDANGVVIPGETTDTGTPAVPELQLVQDPVIYNRPETGLSQLNVPFFKFHNPNGKSAITISMVDVDHTRFDSNSDDTHHYVVVTKARIEIRCLCTVNEQLGLEFRWRGTTHVISAEESNNVRLIAESRANPE